MTLIAAIHKTGEPSFLLSDVALSFGGPPLENTHIPLQQRIQNGYFELPEVTNENISGSSQKMHFWENHAIQWAGSYIVAKAILKFLKTKSSELNNKNIRSFLEIEFGNDLKEVSLIYHFSVENNSIVTHFNCQHHVIGDMQIIFAGSGSYRFWDEFKALGLNKNLPTNFGNVVARLMHLLVQEMHDPNAYYYGFGITYEVGIRYPEGFKKAPYTTCVFSHSEDSFGLRLISSNHYVGDELFVTLALGKNQPNWHMENWVYLPNEFLVDEGKVFHVSNPVNRVVDPAPIFRELLTEKVHVGAQSVFSVAIIEKYGTEREVADGTNFGFVSNVPAAICHFVCAAGFGIVSRALFRREVEEIYLSKTFIPPADQKNFYKKQEEIRVKAVNFDFENIEMPNGSSIQRLET